MAFSLPPLLIIIVVYVLLFPPLLIAVVGLIVLAGFCFLCIPTTELLYFGGLSHDCLSRFTYIFWWTFPAFHFCRWSFLFPRCLLLLLQPVPCFPRCFLLCQVALVIQMLVTCFPRCFLCWLYAFPRFPRCLLACVCFCQ